MLLSQGGHLTGNTHRYPVKGGAYRATGKTPPLTGIQACQLPFYVHTSNLCTHLAVCTALGLSQSGKVVRWAQKEAPPPCLMARLHPEQQHPTALASVTTCHSANLAHLPSLVLPCQPSSVDSLLQELLPLSPGHPGSLALLGATASCQPAA